MKKPVRAGYVFSGILPMAAVAVLMLRPLGSSSRVVSVCLYALGVASLVFAVRKHEAALARVRQGKDTLFPWLRRHTQPLATGLLFLVCGAALTVLVPPGHAEIAAALPADLAERLRRDQERTRISATRVVRAVEEARSLFSDPECTVDPSRKEALLTAWTRYLDHAIELDRLVSTHRFFYRISPVHHLDDNVRSFTLGYTALVAQLAAAVRLVDAVGSSRDVASVLDEPRPDLGLPGESYHRLKQDLIAPHTAIRFHAGRAHLEILKRTGALRRAGVLDLAEATEAAYADVSRRVVKAPGLALDNPLDLLEHAVFHAWFPLQKGAAEAMGDIRTTRRRSLVTPDDVKSLAPLLEPGDVIIERRNWYLSNIGLPGFWPHAALYVGTLEEQDGYFAEEARAATEGAPPSAFVGERWSALREAFAGDASHGRPRVLEAISEGVSLTTLEHSADADYVAVLRPRLSRAQKLAGLVRAYSFHGRPYDFDFDFVTDASIVCSELVFKAYRTAGMTPGLDFALVRTADRWVLPPNELIRKFDAELGKSDAQLDFVAFLDGSERDARATFRDADALRTTWRRPKWDIAQE